MDETNIYENDPVQSNDPAASTQLHEQITKYFETLENLKPLGSPNNRWYHTPSYPCPSCGRCPTCGRGGHDHYPSYPMYPSYPYTPPIWYGPTSTVVELKSNT